MTAPEERLSSQRRRALLALLLLVPVPSVGTLMAMVLMPGPVGQTIFAAGKIWLLIFPVAWWLLVEKGRLSWSRPRRGGLLVGAALGAAVGAVIVAAYWGIGLRLIDREVMRSSMIEIGLGEPLVYLAGAAYWIICNSLIEEYVFRWFIFIQCERLMPSAAAVLASAVVFTVHHVFALQVYLSPALTTLASAGVLIGGLVWSWCYLRYRSIWPGWLSHIVADLAIFAIGWHLVFS